MHWLLLLSLLTSTGNADDQKASGAQLNKLVENALRQELGTSVQHVNVDLKRAANGNRGEFDSFVVNLRGFSADGLKQLERNENSQRSRLQMNSLSVNDYLKGDFKDILGGVFGKKLSTQGRIKHLVLNANDFSYEDVRYNGLRLGLSEMKFDWSSVLGGEVDLKSMAAGNIEVQLAANQAQKLVAPRLPMVKNLKLGFNQGVANLGGEADVYGLNIPFETGGRLSVETNQVRVDDLRLKVAKASIPSFVMKEVTKNVNPLYDFDPHQKWPIAVNMYTATGTGTGTGNTDILQMRGGINWLGFNRGKKTEEKKPQEKEPKFKLPW